MIEENYIIKEKVQQSQGEHQTHIYAAPKP